MNLFKNYRLSNAESSRHRKPLPASRGHQAIRLDAAGNRSLPKRLRFNRVPENSAPEGADALRRTELVRAGPKGVADLGDSPLQDVRLSLLGDLAVANHLLKCIEFMNSELNYIEINCHTELNYIEIN